MIGIDDLPEIVSKIRTALRRAGVNRRLVEARMQRIVRAASTIMDPRMSLLNVATTVSVADLYASLLMVAVADTFRDGEQPGIVGDARSSAEAWSIRVKLRWTSSFVAAAVSRHELRAMNTKSLLAASCARM
jgi:hypothetical protein